MPSNKVICSHCKDECTKEKGVKGIVYWRCIPCSRIEETEGGPKEKQSV